LPQKAITKQEVGSGRDVLCSMFSGVKGVKNHHHECCSGSRLLFYSSMADHFLFPQTEGTANLNPAADVPAKTLFAKECLGQVQWWYSVLEVSRRPHLCFLQSMASALISLNIAFRSPTLDIRARTGGKEETAG
jgi:hypothetical protein